MKYDLAQIAKRFKIYGDYVKAAPYGTGHINDTFLVTYNQAGHEIRYMFQRINHSIFKDPPSLMENIVRVTDHIRGKLQRAGLTDVSRRVLRIIPACDGAGYCQDPGGNYWRAYFFIEGARTYDVLETLEQAYQAAKALQQY